MSESTSTRRKSWGEALAVYLEPRQLMAADLQSAALHSTPAPTPEAGRQLLYELGQALEDSRETSRALAVYLELQADTRDYRDVTARVDRLARIQTES